MDVRCERCRAAYVVDDARIPEAGIKVACPGCGHGFLLRKRVLAVAVPLKVGDGDETIPVSELAPPGDGSQAPVHRGEWRLRQASGAIYPFRELSTLQRWIVERKAAREDEVASGASGEDWRRLGDVPELRSFFALLDRASREAEPRGESRDGRPRPEMEDPAWARDPAPAPRRTTGSLPAIPRPRRRVVWVALLALGLLAVAAGTVYLRHKAEIDAVAHAAATTARPEPPASVPAAPPPAAPAAEESRPAAAVAAGDPVQPPPAAATGPAEVPRAATAPAEPPAAAPPAPADPAKAAPTPGPAARPAPRDEAGAELRSALSRAREQRERGRCEAALDLYGRALAIDGRNATALAGRGACYLDLSRYAQAEASFDAALGSDPRNAEALFGLAETYRYMGRKAEAVATYQRFLAVRPTGEEATATRRLISQLKE